MTVIWFEGRTGISDIAEVFGCSSEQAYERLDEMQENVFDVEPRTTIYSDGSIADDELAWIGNDIGKEIVSDDDCSRLVSAMTKARLITDDQALKLMGYIVQARI